jgi:hypothetical protein
METEENALNGQLFWNLIVIAEAEPAAKIRARMADFMVQRWM